jgi:hypothetical protein
VKLARLALALAVGLTFFVTSRPVRAGDGAIDWRTLHTADADIHYPLPLHAFAVRVAATLHDARRTLEPLFTYKPPERLQVTLDDWSDEANGWATPAPYDHVHFNAYPPAPGSDLGDHGDWVRMLVFHEYAHILHLAEVSGWPQRFNAVFGRQWLPNMALPRLFMEGLAVWAETRHTGGDTAVAGNGGRAWSAAYSARWRAAALDGTIPELHDITGHPVQWPRGTSWYLWGGLLLDHVGRTHGSEKIKEFVRLYGSRVIPFGVQGVSRQVFGKSLSALWQDAVAELRAKVVEEQGILPLPEDGTRLTRDGEWRGRVRPWPEDDGVLRKVVLARGPADARARIERVDVRTGQAEVLHVCVLDCDEAMVTPDRKWLIFTESRKVRRVYQFRELIAVELGPDGRALAGQGDGLRLTNAARIRSPSLDPAGQYVVAVQVADGRTHFATLPLADAVAAARNGGELLTPTRIWSSSELTQVLDAPLVAGDALWFTKVTGGRRELWRATWQGGGQPVHGDVRWTGTDATHWLGDLQLVANMRLGAVVEQQGRRFAAETPLDATAVAWVPRSRSSTGVVSAAMDAGTALTVAHRGPGLDLMRHGHLPPVTLAPTATPVVAEPAYRPPAAVIVDQGPYGALPTLYPRTWTPSGVITNRLDSSWLGFQASGRDVLRHWQLDLFSQFRADLADPTAQLGLTWSRLEPEFAADVAYQPGVARFRRGWNWYATPTHRIGGRLLARWALDGLRDDWQFEGSGRVVHSSLQLRDFDVQAPHDPGGPPPSGPWSGFEGLADIRVGYVAAERYPDSVADERMHRYTLNLRVGDRLTDVRPTGSGTRLRLVSDFATAHHFALGGRKVLSLSGRLGLAPEHPDSGPAFAVRGESSLGSAVLLGSEGNAQAAVVRGMPGAADAISGDGMLWGSVEVIGPLLDPGRGLDALPIYARRLTWGAFVDGAATFWHHVGTETRDGWVLGVGSELRLDYELGYALPARARLGTGWGIGSVSGWALWLVLGV